MDTQAITIRLPADLYERLRREAFDSRTSQNAIIVKELTDRYKRQDRKNAAQEGSA